MVEDWRQEASLLIFFNLVVKNTGLLFPSYSLSKKEKVTEFITSEMRIRGKLKIKKEEYCLIKDIDMVPILHLSRFREPSN